MKRFVKALCFVLALLMATLVALPFKTFNILASDMNIKQVAVTDEGHETQYQTNAKTVSDLFSEQKITLTAKDQCSTEMNQPITDGMQIYIQRAREIIVSVNGAREKRLVTAGATIERMMLTLQTEWNTALVYEGDEKQAVKNGDVLNFLTWESEIINVSQPIPYETFEIETTALMMDVTNQRQSGVPGELQQTISVVNVGGAERQREILTETVVTEPVPEIIDIGIGGTLGTTTDTQSPSFMYEKKLRLNASAYTAGFESTGKNPGDPGYGITKSGEHVRRGIVSVDPSVIPLGTKLYVEGYGYSLAADTGSGIKGNMIDLYYESLDDALQFGRRDLVVYVLG